MKKLIAISSLLIVAAFIVSSCGKYEEGPAISLKSKTSRVAATWEFDKIIVNGTEEDISFFSGFQFILEKDGTGKAKWGTLEQSLEWELDDAKEKIRMRFQSSSGTWEDWDDDSWSTIIKLKETEMWMQDEYLDDLNNDGTDETVVEETHFKKVG